MKSFLTWCLIALHPALVAGQSPRGRTLEVPAGYPTIQSAIDAANSGDSIVVAPGVYRERITFGGRSLALVSRFSRTRNPNDILVTIIDGSGAGHPDSGSTVRIVDREDSSTVLEGFTIIGGGGSVWRDAAGRADFREGGGVLCELSSPTIRFNRILGGRAAAPRDGRIRSSGGGGIRCGYAEPTIEGNLIAGNRGRYGAGLVLFHSASVVRHNIVVANSGGEDFGGAGVWIVGNLSRRLTTRFEQNLVVGNTTLAADSGTSQTMLGKGGGALFARVNLAASGNHFSNNIQPASRQVGLGPSIQGRPPRLADERTAAGGRLIGPFQVPAALMIVAGGGQAGTVLNTLVRAEDRAADDAAPADLVALRRELLAADSLAGAGTAKGIANRLTEALARDALVIGPRTTLWRGATATREALQSDTANANASVHWRPIRGDVSADGTEGYTFGFLDVSGGSSPRPAWKYLAYWRRDSIAGWRILAHKRLPREPGEHEQQPPAGFETPAHRVGSWFPGGNDALREMMAWDSAFARAASQSGAAKAFLSYTARDGATLAGGPNFAWGTEKVAAEFASFAPGTIDWAPDVGHVAPSADLGFATGEVVFREKAGDGALTEVARARYFTIWKRQPDGVWKLIIDG